MLPEWLQVLYAIVIVVMIPFCAWVMAKTQKNAVDITKVQAQIEAMKEANDLRLIEVDSRCRAEHEGRGQVRDALGRLERNVVMIGTKMELMLEPHE